MDRATGPQLVTASQVAEDTGDSDKLEQLILPVKAGRCRKGYTSDGDIDNTINDVAGQLNISPIGRETTPTDPRTDAETFFPST